jgi:trans-aconitate methyltransferase
VPDWDAYYAASAGREPRPLLLEALARFAAPGTAADLGYGGGTETLAMLRAGWRVTAVDADPAAGPRLAGQVAGLGGAAAGRLCSVTADLATYQPPRSELVWAGYSLFFVPEPGFSALWGRIRAALVPGGRFAGQFMGPHDSWAAEPGFTAVTQAAARDLLAGLVVEKFEVLDAAGDAFSGPKHWHLFHVIARAPG